MTRLFKYIQKLFKYNLDKFHIRVLFTITIFYSMCDVMDIKFDINPGG